jgi:transcription termination/antitermination protein NusG
MKKQWFVLHTLSGHEYKVKSNIASRVQQEEMEELIGEILVPTEKVSEVKQGKKSTVNRKFFPGYVLANLAVYNEDGSFNERTWYFIQNTPSVIGFLGGERPSPLSDKEVDSIVNQIEDKKETVKPKVMFEPGETVKVTDGPFMNFSGMIEEVDPERGKLKISVSIFGRSAPVELEYWQVERTAE